MATEPTLSDIESRADAAIASRLSGATPQLPVGIIPGFRRALVGGFKALFGYLNNLFTQATPYGATGQNSLNWSSLWNVTPRGAVAATGPTAATSGTTGADIPAGTALQDGLGNSYTTNADAAVPAALALTAVTPGAAGNQAAGTTLTFVSPPAGVNPTVTVGTGGLTGGLDAETWQQVKQRAQDRRTNPPQGGSDNDYVVWAKAGAPSLTRAWPFPLYNGLGTIRIYVVDDNYAGPGLASSAEVTAAQTYINQPGVKPAGCARIVSGVVVSGAEVVAPTATAVNFNFGGTLPAQVQAAVQAALKALFYTAQPEAGLSRQQMIGVVGDAAGTWSFVMSTPSTDQVAAAGHLLTLGTITW